jgi:uncharacterized protein
MSGPGTATSAPAEVVAGAVAAARAALAARVGEVNDLNVFPVADGDTGTNMLLTVVAVEEAAAATTGMARAERCAALARAALVGARGNSGMILSQLVRGAAGALAGGAGPPDGRALAAALRAASAAADAAVREPVEGTMLTVARRVAEAAEEAGDDVGALADAVTAAARDAVAATREQLDVLSEAGVVDSGALGVAILLEGAAAALTGRPTAAGPAAAAPAAPSVDHLPSRYRYCTSFLVEGAAMDLDALEAALLPLGDSLLVMGDPAQAKVHVHTDAPERAAAAAAAFGAVDALRWDDMRRQEAERAARLARRAAPAASCVAIAVADGDGVRELAAGLGATALAAGGGAAALTAALDAVAPAQAVVVATGADADDARAAAEGRQGVAVVEAASLPALLAALVEADPDGEATEVAAAMDAAASAVRSAAVGGGDPQALRDGLSAALAPLLGAGPALVTVLVGAGAGVEPPVVEGWARALAAEGTEVEAHAGGQAAPALAVGVE